MKSLCKKTQRLFMFFDGDVNRLRESHPELADHLKTCPVCQAEAKKIVHLFRFASAQRIQIRDEEFWTDFDMGLQRKLRHPPKSSFWQKIRWQFNRVFREMVFQPAYRVGFAFAILFLVSYFGYHAIINPAANVLDPYDYLYQSYQEASNSNPIFQSFSDPTDEFIELADVSTEEK